MDFEAFFLRARCSLLLLSANRRLAQADSLAARSDVERIFYLYELRGIDVPVHVLVMRALVAWNLGDLKDTETWVRRASDKIEDHLRSENSVKNRNELQYLRAYCWTLLHYPEAAGRSVHWDVFADLIPARHVDVSAVSGTTRWMFPVDEEVFVLRHS